jgi:hypothetical protein
MALRGIPMRRAMADGIKHQTTASQILRGQLEQVRWARPSSYFNLTPDETNTPFLNNTQVLTLRNTNHEKITNAF